MYTWLWLMTYTFLWLVLHLQNVRRWCFPQANWTRNLRQQKGQELQKDRRQWFTQPFCMLRPRVKGDKRRVHVYFHEIKDFHWFPAVFQSDISIKNAIPSSCLRLVLRVLQVTLSADWSGKSPRVWSRDLWWHAMKLSSFDSTGPSAKKRRNRGKQIRDDNDSQWSCLTIMIMTESMTEIKRGFAMSAQLPPRGY